MPENKIKIIYILNSLALGGAEKLVLDICRNLDKEQFDISVCSVVGGGPLENEFRKLNLPVKIFEKKTKLGLGVLWQLIGYLRKEKPQIVHTHIFGGDTWGRLAAIITRVPFIISTEHSINLDENILKKIVKLILSWFSDKIIAVSHSVKEHSIKVEKISSKKIKVIYNGINTQKFIFKGYQQIDLDKKINAVIVARLEPVKGHQYFFKAMPLILEKYPNFILNIVGAGSLEEKLKEQVKELKIENNVKFLGMKLNPEEILKQMDLFILPSQWEGLGVVLLEAQAIGLPVLTSDIPGTREVVEDKETGLLFDYENPTSIFRSVEVLFTHPELHEKIITNAHNQVENRFTINKMVNNYQQLYLRLINK